jgi:hypothetical protein
MLMDVGGKTKVGVDARTTGTTLIDESLANLRAWDGSEYLIEVEVEFAITAGGTFNAARWDAATKAFFPVTSSGITSIRNIAGTDTLSQHAYGNAVDTFASYDTLTDIFYFGIANAAAFSIRLLIWQTTQWTSYGGFSGYPGVPHTGHVHADFHPQYGGVPPGYPIPGS